MRVCVNSECPDVIAGHAEYADEVPNCHRCGQALQLAAPARVEDERRRYSGNLVTVVRTKEPQRASVYQTVLEDAGILTFVQGGNQTLAGGASVFGGILDLLVQVPEEQAEEALAVLAQAQAGAAGESIAPGAPIPDGAAVRRSVTVPVPRVGLPFLLYLLVAAPLLGMLLRAFRWSNGVAFLVFGGTGLLFFWGGRLFPAKVLGYSCSNCGREVAHEQSFCDGCDRRLLSPPEGAEAMEEIG